MSSARSISLRRIAFSSYATKENRKGKVVPIEAKGKSKRSGKISRLGRVNGNTSGCFVVVLPGIRAFEMEIHPKIPSTNASLYLCRNSPACSGCTLAPPFCFITRCDTSRWRHLGFHVLLLAPFSSPRTMEHVPRVLSALLCYGIPVKQRLRERQKYRVTNGERVKKRENGKAYITGGLYTG